MRSTKGNSIGIHEEDEDYDDEFSAKKDGTSNSKDSKNNHRANAIRSKHSVTEQRRRCKINERFQILRELVPDGDHKRDTASFLLEVIEYVQVLQEKVQKYEASCQPWSTEASKLMPWRHSQWRNQGLPAQPLSINNGCGPAMPICGKLDEKSVESDANQDAYNRSFGELQSDLTEKVAALPSPFQAQMPLPVQTESMFAHPCQGVNPDSQSNDCPVMSDNWPDEQSIEGGTISISSTYSQELLTTLTQALQSSGVDLSKARISIQIDLGKRANQALASDIPHVKDCNQREGVGQETLDQAHKRLRS